MTQEGRKTTEAWEYSLQYMNLKKNVEVLRASSYASVGLACESIFSTNNLPQ